MQIEVGMQRKLSHFLTLMACTAFIGYSHCSLANNQLTLFVHGQNLTADGSGLSFTPVKTVNQQPLVAENVGRIQCTQNSQISLDLGASTARLGEVIDTDGQPITVFDAGYGIGFTLHFGKNGETLTGLRQNQFYQCRDGGDYRVKATFYRHNHANLIKANEGLGIQKRVNLSITYVDQPKKDMLTIRLDGGLMFAKNPEDYSCTLTNNTMQTIYLGEVSVKELESGSPVRKGGSAKFTLDCPKSPNVQVMAMIYDVLDTTNFGANQYTLNNRQGENFAKGVGVQLVKAGEDHPIPLGRKNHQSMVAPAFDGTQWRLSDNRSLELQGQLVKTGDITPGKVESIAGILFIYQ